MAVILGCSWYKRCLGRVSVIDEGEHLFSKTCCKRFLTKWKRPSPWRASTRPLLRSLLAPPHLPWVLPHFLHSQTLRSAGRLYGAPHSGTLHRTGVVELAAHSKYRSPDESGDLYLEWAGRSCRILLSSLGVEMDKDGFQQLLRHTATACGRFEKYGSKWPFKRLKNGWYCEKFRTRRRRAVPYLASSKNVILFLDFFRKMLLFAINTQKPRETAFKPFCGILSVDE